MDHFSQDSGAPNLDALRERAAVEQSTLNSLIAVTEAESTVTSARTRDLGKEWKSAARRASAARGQLTKARKAGDKDKIAAAEEHAARMQSEAERILDFCMDELESISRAGLDRVGEVYDQVRAAWAAQDAVNDVTWPRAR